MKTTTLVYRTILLFLPAAVLVYAGEAYYWLQPDPTKWSIDGRGAFIGILLFTIAISVFIIEFDYFVRKK